MFQNLKSNILGATALIAGSSLVATNAMAASTVGSIASTAIEAAGPQVTLVITAMVGVLLLLVVWALVRKAFGK